MEKRIKVFCHSCEGKKYVEEKQYPNAEIVKVVCPECNGEGYVHDELWQTVLFAVQES